MVPGIGTIVKYHYLTGVDVPAMVVATAEGWSPDMASFYSTDAPQGSNVHLVAWQSPGSPSSYVYDVTRGSGVGEYDLLTVEAHDIRIAGVEGDSR